MGWPDGAFGEGNLVLYIANLLVAPYGFQNTDSGCLHILQKKKSEPVLPNFGDNERMMESGFVIPQDIPNHSWIKRGLDAAPNRYGIKPGRHWDGVDRSNGRFTATVRCFFYTFGCSKRKLFEIFLLISVFCFAGYEKELFTRTNEKRATEREAYLWSVSDMWLELIFCP